MQFRTALMGFILLVILFVCCNPVWAVDIQLDGNFEDWQGKAFLSDPAYDSSPSGDILNFYWSTNGVNSDLYFMIERRGWGDYPDSLPTTYRLNLDINDNGVYHNGVDRYVLVTYSPFLKGLETVSVYKGNDQLVNIHSGFWGESGIAGGQKCEFAISTQDLSNYPGQSMRMYLNSIYLINDRVPNTGDIQWSPIPILGTWWLAIVFFVVLIMATISIKRRKSIWFTGFYR